MQKESVMTDNQLVQITRELDNILAAVSIKYQISPLCLAAIVNARLILACEETGGEDDYYKLLTTIQAKQFHKTFTPIYSH